MPRHTQHCPDGQCPEPLSTLEMDSAQNTPSTLRTDSVQNPSAPTDSRQGQAGDHPFPSSRTLSPHRCDRFISLATRWDMATAATLRGSVMPMMLLSLGERDRTRELCSGPLVRPMVTRGSASGLLVQSDPP